MKDEAENLDQQTRDEFVSNRPQLIVSVGNYAQWHDKVYRIFQVLDFDSIIAIDIDTGLCAMLRIKELRQAESLPAYPTSIADIGDEKWRIAQQRYAAIYPLVREYGYADPSYRAKDIGVAVANLVQWVRLYTINKSVLALLPQDQPPRMYLAFHVEDVIQSVINSFYSSSPRPTIQKTIQEVFRQCRLRNLTPPSPDIVRARLARIPQREYRWHFPSSSNSAKISPVQNPPQHLGLTDKPIAFKGEIQ